MNGAMEGSALCNTGKSFFGCCQLAEWDLIIRIMRTHFHCFNLTEGVRKKDLFPPLGEKMLNCGPYVKRSPISSTLLLAKPPRFGAFYHCSKKSASTKFLLVLPLDPMIDRMCLWCWHLSPAAVPKHHWVKLTRLRPYKMLPAMSESYCVPLSFFF